MDDCHSERAQRVEESAVVFVVVFFGSQLVTEIGGHDQYLELWRQGTRRRVLINCMAPKRFTWATGSTATLAGFFLLCILLAVGAMRSDLFPDMSSSSVPQMEREAVPFALFAIAAGLLSVLSSVLRHAQRPHPRHLWAAVLIGLGLFVAPALLVYLSRDSVSSLTRVALLSLVPVFAGVLEPHIAASEIKTSPSKTAMLGALAAVLGTLCIFPVAIPDSLQAGAAFAAVIASAAWLAAANCYAVRVASESPARALLPIAAIAGATAAIGLIIATAFTGGLVLRPGALASELGWSAMISVPGLLLLFWLMSRMTATRMTTRFVLAPLFAILFSSALEHPKIELRIYLGLLLIAGGAGWILFASDEDPDVASPLSLHREP